MKCTYCGTEMETGYVQSMKEIIYSTNLHTSRIMIPKKDDIKLTYDPWSPASCRGPRAARRAGRSFFRIDKCRRKGE